MTPQHDCKQTANIQKLFDLSIPAWVRTLLVSAILALFALYGHRWVYAAGEFATKEELRQTKSEITIMFREILTELKSRGR